MSTINDDDSDTLTSLLDNTAGRDTITSATDIETLSGGRDTILGDDQELIYGDEGNDSISNFGRDTILGGSDTETILGDFDTISGGLGDDQIT